MTVVYWQQSIWSGRAEVEQNDVVKEATELLYRANKLMTIL